MSRVPRLFERKLTERPIPILPGPIQIGDRVGLDNNGELFEMVVLTEVPGWHSEKLIICDPHNQEYWLNVDAKELIPTAEWALMKALKGIHD